MYLVFSHGRLLVMLLMKAYMRNKHNWGAFHYWNLDLSTRCVKWQLKRPVDKGWMSLIISNFPLIIDFEWGYV